jgi:predicted Zn-dependent peptidase
MVISPDDASAQVMAVTKEQITQVANKITLDTIYFLKGTLKNEEGAQ